MIRIQVDIHCARTGYCARLAPGIFTLEDEKDSVTVVKREVVAGSHESEQAFDAESTCPVGAITVEDIANE